MSIMKKFSPSHIIFGIVFLIILFLLWFFVFHSKTKAPGNNQNTAGVVVNSSN